MGYILGYMWPYNHNTYNLSIILALFKLFNLDKFLIKFLIILLWLIVLSNLLLLFFFIKTCIWFELVFIIKENKIAILTKF